MPRFKAMICKLLALTSVLLKALPLRTAVPALVASLVLSAAVMGREVIPLDRAWQFHLGDFDGSGRGASGAAAPSDPSVPSYDDRSWKTIDVPHDYVVEGTFTNKGPKLLAYGALPLGVGWYRRKIEFPPSAAGKIAWLEFDGVYRDSRYWLDGKPLGEHASGFIGYHVDLGPAPAGKTSVLAVRVDPRKPEGWWYDGGGIYRHVRLVLVDPVHVAHWGVFVHATVPNPGNGVDAPAAIQVSTDLVNQSAAPVSLNVLQEVLDDRGAVVTKAETNLDLPVGDATDQQKLSLADARLWSCEHPVLYTLRTTIRRGNEIVAQVTTPFGVRDVRFDSDHGLFLNGRHVEIKGVCLHQDAAGVGVALPDRLMAWRLERLKNVGVNAIRSHHALAPEMLDDCDRMGVLVLDEFRQLGDDYGKAKPTTTSNHLENQADQVRRDRNHPSVIIWSLCNEEFAVQGTPEGERLASALKALIERLDGTRPVTAALVYATPRSKGQDVYSKQGILGPVDVIGFNYGIENWDKVHADNPGKPCVVTELTRMMNTRGVYAMDKFKGGRGDAALGLCNQYSTVAEESWKAVASRPWLAGVFVWVGFDFKGEPKPVAWPPVAAQKGILDSCGFEKDSAWYYKAWWKDEPSIHLFPHWNWPGKEGQEISVWVYSNADEVELFLNGVSQGKQAMKPNGHLEWPVKYQPGTLEARGSWNGRTLSDTVVTTGAPARIVLAPDRVALAADGADLSVIAVKVVDREGRVVPTATNFVHFTVTGAGSVLGVGNGDPACHEPDKASQRSAFAGLCQLLVQAARTPGDITVRADADGLEPASIHLAAR